MKLNTNNKINFLRSKGFTLIELIVVIAIIAVLASITITTLSAARAKTRDAYRYQSLVQLRTAINRYFTENGSYPSTGGAWYSSEPGDTAGSYNADWVPGLVAAKMIPALPRDPQGGVNTINCVGGQMRAFLYRSNGTNFKLISNCAVEGVILNSSQWYDQARTTSIQTTDNPAITALW